MGDERQSRGPGHVDRPEDAAAIRWRGRRSRSRRQRQRFFFSKTLKGASKFGSGSS